MNILYLFLNILLYSLDENQITLKKRGSRSNKLVPTRAFELYPDLK